MIIAREAKGNILAHILDCFFLTFPFLVDPGTGILIKNGLPTLGKRSINCVAHAKQDKTVICKIVFNGFSVFNKGSSFFILHVHV